MKIHILVFAGRCNDRVRSTVGHQETAVSNITEQYIHTEFNTVYLQLSSDFVLYIALNNNNNNNHTAVANTRNTIDVKL